MLTNGLPLGGATTEEAPNNLTRRLISNGIPPVGYHSSGVLHLLVNGSEYALPFLEYSAQGVRLVDERSLPDGMAVNGYNLSEVNRPQSLTLETVRKIVKASFVISFFQEGPFPIHIPLINLNKRLFPIPIDKLDAVFNILHMDESEEAIKVRPYFTWMMTNLVKMLNDTVVGMKQKVRTQEMLLIPEQQPEDEMMSQLLSASQPILLNILRKELPLLEGENEVQRNTRLFGMIGERKIVVIGDRTQGATSISLPIMPGVEQKILVGSSPRELLAEKVSDENIILTISTSSELGSIFGWLQVDKQGDATFPSIQNGLQIRVLYADSSGVIYSLTRDDNELKLRVNVHSDSLLIEVLSPEP